MKVFQILQINELISAHQSETLYSAPLYIIGIGTISVLNTLQGYCTFGVSKLACILVSCCCFWDYCYPDYLEQVCILHAVCTFHALPNCQLDRHKANHENVVCVCESV